MQTGELQSFGELSESGQWIEEFRPCILVNLNLSSTRRGFDKDYQKCLLG